MGGNGLGWSDLDPTSSDFGGGTGTAFSPGGRNPMAGKGRGGKGKKGPEAPDFASLAKQQAEYSKEAAAEQTRQNRPNQYGPFGSSEWTQGADGRWTQTQSLSPELQGISSQLQSSMAGSAQIDPAKARDQAIEAAYRQSTSRLDPQWAQRESSMAQSLANQGFSVGDEGYTKAMSDLSRGRNDAYEQAMYGAQTGAGNAAFGQSLSANMQPYQQLSQIANLGKPSSFIPAAGAEAPQLLAAAMQQYGANVDQYNAQQAQKNSKMNGAASAAPYIASASDERLKTDIVRLEAEAIPGVHWARWKWRDGSGAGFGVIAQDLEKVRPDLVTEIGGVKHVYYWGLR
jgi:hypothetical protein